MDRRSSFHAMQRDMALFSQQVLGIPLHEYQVEWANYLLQVVAERRNETIAIEMPRQSGKNETSAQVEVAIIARFAKRGGAVVKCAPTWKPQIVNSKLRFEQRSGAAQQRLSFLKFTGSSGYMYRCGAALIQFLSAAPEASVVGATASLLMEVDESQDVNLDKFDKDFAPMRASTGAPVVHYGTPWTDSTLLERTKTEIDEGRVKGKYFRVLPERIALSNPRYGEYVDNEVRRLGREHPLIRTQYYLEPLPESGRMVREQQLRLMIGDHARRDRRKSERWIVAGLDFAGSDEDSNELSSLMTAGSRDSVALTIGEMELVTIADGLSYPLVRILDRYEWVNLRPDSLHSALYQILHDRWSVDLCHADATGIGSTGTAFLATAINQTGDPERIAGQTFDGAWTTHTRIAFNYLAAINGGRLLDWQPEEDDDPIQLAKADHPEPTWSAAQHIWWQRGHARLEAKAGKKVRAHVPEKEGHDDLLVSDMLMYDAATALSARIMAEGDQTVRVFSRRRR